MRVFTRLLGFTQCLAILCKEQNLVLEGLKKGRVFLPFPLLGVDTPGFFVLSGKSA